jgi:undecaprenyl phosphate N,N'-diacetylbacillosamine 1-phosphate transferase
VSIAADRPGQALGLWVKTAVEWCVALLALVCLLPLLLLIAALIKLTSPGPVLYLADRLGRHGHSFRMMKFRSMVVGAPEHVTEDDRVTVDAADPRLTPLGGFLRLGFDELPQLLNVLKGEMALVGPRPDTVWMLPKYSDEIRPRLDVRPGLTGLAQILRGRDLSPLNNYRLDCHYVANWSPWVDLKIVLYTLPYIAGVRNIGRGWLRRLVPEAAAALDGEP